jgi:hypothetical protein
MRKRKYVVQDDSVTRRGDGHPEYVGKSVTQRGEELRRRSGPEPGRIDVVAGDTAAARQEEAGESTARLSTGVFPQDPIDPRMPRIPAP